MKLVLVHILVQIVFYLFLFAVFSDATSSSYSCITA